jgi:hypothetical protein
MGQWKWGGCKVLNLGECEVSWLFEWFGGWISYHMSKYASEERKVIGLELIPVREKKQYERKELV